MTHSPINGELLGTFQECWLNSRTIMLLRNATALLNQMQPIHYRLRAGLLFHRVTAARRHGVTSVLISNSSYPRAFTVLVIPKNDDVVLFPAERASDFLRLVELLKLDNLAQIVILDSLLVAHDPVFALKSAPKRILTMDDARECGFEFRGDLNKFSGDTVSLWWERWGGTLYSFTFVRDPVKPIRERKILETSIGDYKPLPGDWEFRDGRFQKVPFP